MSLFRYKLLVEFDGTGFAGWQRMKDEPSIQESLEDAVFAFCGDRNKIIAAGRTDAGVHASGMVVHVDLSQEHDPFTVMNAINYHLLQQIGQKIQTTHGTYLIHPIAVMHAERVDEEFSARFSATARHYRYRIMNRRPPPVLEAKYVWHVHEPLDVDAMREGASHLVGHHDFTSFRDTQCQSKSPEKTLDTVDIEKCGDEIHLNVSSRSFLHHQVRIITGSLKHVGSGKWPPEKIKEILEARDRRAGGPTAPAQGLSLIKVDY